MVTQIKIYETPILAIAIIGGFTEKDFDLVQKWATAKREKGFEKANLLIKLDELNISESSAKAIFEQILKLMHNFKDLKKIAIVGQSEGLKKAIKIDNFFFQKFNMGGEEKYFDVYELDKAFAFIES